MALETATYISDLVETNPEATDSVATADDHMRLIKATIKATFPNVTGALSATHTELNYVDGVTSAIQTQLDSKLGVSDTATLTNKTISADSNTLSGIAASSFVLSNASGNIDGSAAQKAIPSGVVVGTTDTQTLTNKTLTNPSLGNSNLTSIKTATFNSQTTIATTTGAITVDWSSAQNQLQTEPTGTITYTFTAPDGPCHLQLIINSDGTSTAQTINWPGSVVQYGTTWAGVNNKKSVINFWYDGATYHMIGSNQV